MIITDKIAKKENVFSDLVSGSFSSVGVCLAIHSVSVSLCISRETLSGLTKPNSLRIESSSLYKVSLLISVKHV